MSEAEQQEREFVPVEEIKKPSRDEKLHPDELEDNFVESVGEEPNKPLEVYENDDGDIELIDGDRRLRALEINEAEEAPVFFVDVEDTAEKSMRMIVANEDREDSDPEQRARVLARHVAPWLLEPANRLDWSEKMTQEEMADRMNKSQTTIRTWLEPLRDEAILRDALAQSMGGRVSDEETMHTIDEIVDKVRTGGEDSTPIVAEERTHIVADAYNDVGTEVDIEDIKELTDEAIENGWNANKYIDEIQELGPDVTTAGVESGVVGDDDFVDDEPTENRDGDGTTGSDDTGTTDTTTVDDEEVDFSLPYGDGTELDIEDYVGDVIPEELWEKHKDANVFTAGITGDTAVLVNILADMEDFNSPDKFVSEYGTEMMEETVEQHMMEARQD